MRALVLGSEGTLGRSLCKHLDTCGVEVVKWDIKLGDRYDLRKPNCIDEVLRDVDYVFFLAFDVGGAKYDVRNKSYLDNNIMLIHNTFDSLSRAGKPFCYTTSQMANMITNPYGVLKCLSDFYVKYLNGVNVRLWNVYGNEPIDEKSHVIPDFVHQALTTGEINMMSDGSDERQFMHSFDFADALYHIMQNHELYKQQNRIIDLTTFQWTTINNVADIIKDVIGGRNIVIKRKPYSCNNHTHKNEPIRSLFHDNWCPKLTIEEGISQVIKDYIRHTSNNNS